MSASDGQRVVVLPALSVEVWHALSASGELRNLRDVELLAKVARAYRHVAKTRFLEEQAVRTMYSDGSFQQPSIEMLRSSDEGTAMSLNIASGAVAHALELLSGPRRQPPL
jgi:hypothetical protein